MKAQWTILWLLITNIIHAQVLPANRMSNWTQAGLLDTIDPGSTIIDLAALGAIADGIYCNDTILQQCIDTISTEKAFIILGSGNYKFCNSIQFKNGITIKGQGANMTSLSFDLAGSGNAFDIHGGTTVDTAHLIMDALKNSDSITLFNAASFVPGDWISININDSNLVTSSWALGTVGQICRIDAVNGNQLKVYPDLRMDFLVGQQAVIRKISPIRDCGIECLRIERIDNTAPQQSSSVSFRYAVNCWITGVESSFCTFSHVKAEYSSNLLMARNYFHHGFDYGGGGRAYGVALQFSTGSCLVEDNIFQQLRHAVLLQAGANGNVIAYNYSKDPFWTNSPNDAAGDMVLHGNYVFSNLFEQNICQNIVIDNSHGPNGPFNTFFRNRAENYGLFFSASNSPDQNLIGNEITNTSFPQSLFNFYIQGTGHFLYANNDKGTILPTGTNNLSDLSYHYSQPPAFLSSGQFAGIGYPNMMDQNSIASRDRYLNQQFFSYDCEDLFTSIPKAETPEIEIYPNPVEDILWLSGKKAIKKLKLIDLHAKTIFEVEVNDSSFSIDIRSFRNGIYYLWLEMENGVSVSKIVHKK